MRIYSLMLLLSVFTLPSFAQDSVLMKALLQRAMVQQISNDSFFIQGIFPSYISGQPHFSRHKKDNNVFFTALVDYTLKNIDAPLEKAGLNSSSIHAKALTAYPYFKNKKGRSTYNFWRTDAAYPFPYTWWIHAVKKNTALPDDMDDTVLTLLAQNADSARAVAVHTAMQLYVNSNKKKAKAVDKNYRQYKDYSVWYGRNFPAVMDVCVLSNVLLFVQQYNLEWTAADSASLQVITDVVSSKDYIKKPLTVSPYYGNTSIIIYHVARLMSRKPIPQLEVLKVDLLTAAINQFSHTKNSLEKAILCTAIMRLGYVPPLFEMPGITAIEQNDLPFFIGNIPSYFPTGLRQFFYRKAWGLFYHYCPAYNDVLFLEYLTLKDALTADK